MLNSIVKPQARFRHRNETGWADLNNIFTITIFDIIVIMERVSCKMKFLQNKMEEEFLEKIALFLT